MGREAAVREGKYQGVDDKSRGGGTYPKRRAFAKIASKLSVWYCPVSNKEIGVGWGK